MGIGLGAESTSVAATMGTPGTLTDGTSDSFTWSAPVRALFIQNNDSAANLYISLNGTAASLTDYDARIRPGTYLAIPPAFGLLFRRVHIHADGDDAVYGTDFVVKGWV